MMNRNASLPQFWDEEYLITQGANPRAFTKNIEITYKPNTLAQIGLQDNNISSPAQGGEIRFNRWVGSLLQTTTSPFANPTLNTDVEFYGMAWILRQPTHFTNNVMGYLKITAHWEFKQPSTLQLTTPASQVKTISKANRVITQPEQA